MKQINSKHVVFVTGCFVTHRGWDTWKDFFEERGYRCTAPAWPHKDGSPSDLRRRQPDAGIASNRLAAVIDHYAGIIKGLPEKPIVIGHSFGGLMTQILVNRGLAEAGVAIHSVPPQGVLAYEWPFFRSTWGALGLFTSAKKSYLMPFKTWQYAFTNGMSLADQQKAYDENTIPESKLLARDALTRAARVDFTRPHVPLLFVSGSADQIMPATLNKRNFNRYKRNGSTIEYKVFAGNNHYVLGMPTWRTTAGYVAEWLAAH